MPFIVSLSTFNMIEAMMIRSLLTWHGKSGGAEDKEEHDLSSRIGNSFHVQLYKSTSSSKYLMWEN